MRQKEEILQKFGKNWGATAPPPGSAAHVMKMSSEKLSYFDGNFWKISGRRNIARRHLETIFFTEFLKRCTKNSWRILQHANSLNQSDYKCVKTTQIFFICTKLHKVHFSTHFIAGSIKCTTKDLSCLLTKWVTIIEDELIRTVTLKCPVAKSFRLSSEIDSIYHVIILSYHRHFSSGRQNHTIK